MLNTDSFERFVKKYPGPVVDHTLLGRAKPRKLIRPPIIREIEPEFKSLVEKVAILKIEELYKDKKRYLREIKETKPINKLHARVLKMAPAEYEKTFQLWLRYWLRLTGYRPEVTAFNNDEKVEKARAFPIQELVVDPYQIGSRWTAKCPNHNPEGARERSRSFYIFEDNSFHCFSCGFHGNNAVDFVQKLNPDMSFKEILEKLQ